MPMPMPPRQPMPPPGAGPGGQPPMPGGAPPMPGGGAPPMAGPGGPPMGAPQPDPKTAMQAQIMERLRQLPQPELNALGEMMSPPNVALLKRILPEIGPMFDAMAVAANAGGPDQGEPDEDQRGGASDQDQDEGDTGGPAPVAPSFPRPATRLGSM